MAAHRREFLKLTSALGLGMLMPSLGAVSSCTPRRDIRVTVSGPDHTRGHRIRDTQVQHGQAERLTRDVVIIGAGISGLSTAYFLNRRAIGDVLVLELNDAPGGNSSFGTTVCGAHPHGAHYINQPNSGNTPLIDFLRESGIITAIDEQGRIVYNDTELCFDPEERLFLRGTFQEGLIPSYGLRSDETAEIARFLALMDAYRYEQGSDGRFFFDIPYAAASTDTKYNDLDAMTFRAFLSQQGFTGEYLLWYIDYCCRDDFGGGIDRISAWAGVNYFASHRPHPSTTDPARVLTWPEGNGRLMNLLLQDVRDRFRASCAVTHIGVEGDSVVVHATDYARNTAMELRCRQCVVAVPPFVASRILDPALPYPRQHVRALRHAPWIVATVLLSAEPGGRGRGLCWDNVGYGTRALGYIYNQHQSLKQKQEHISISLYMPLDDGEYSDERRLLLSRTAGDWQRIVLAELEQMHSGISAVVEEIDIWRWGHGMALPAVGLVKSGILQELARPIDNRIFFAHTDLTGYSTFEEGFDWGYRTAEQIARVL